MAAIKFLQIIGLLTVFATVEGVKPAVHITKPIVLVGGDTEVHCDIEGFKSGHFVVWHKHAAEGDDRLELANMADANDVVERVLPNYAFSVGLIDPEDETLGARFVMSITGAKTEYSGEYGCHLGGNGADADTKFDIDVISAPTEIKMFVNDEEVTEDMEVEHAHKEGVRVRCTASGGYPEPVVQFMVEANDESHFLDTNSEVTYGDSDISEELSVFPARDGMTTVEGDVTLTSSFNNKQMYCQAHTAGMEADEVLSKYYLVKFSGTPPMISCNQVMIMEPLQKAMINCSVEAVPPIQEASVSFVTGLNTTRTLRPGEKFGSGMRLWLKNDDSDDGRSYLILGIEKVFPEMFRNYTFTVSNPVGKESIVVTLEKDPEYKESTDSVARISSCLATTMFTLLTFYLMSL